MTNPEQFNPEIPAGSLSTGERENIRTRASLRRLRAEMRRRLLEIAPEQESAGMDSYHRQTMDRVNREMAGEAQIDLPAPEIKQKADGLEQQAYTAKEQAPNLAAYRFALAAQLRQTAGLPFATVLEEAQLAIEKTGTLPKNSPNALLPEAIIIGIQTKQVKDLPEIEPARVVAGLANDEGLLADYALVLPENQRDIFLRQLPEDEQKRTSAMMDHALSTVLKEGLPTAKEEKTQVSAVRRRVAEHLEAALAQKPSDPAPVVKALTETLYTLSDKDSKDVILNLARKAVDADTNKKETARIFYTLINMDTHKGNSLAIELVGDRNVPDHVAWLFLKKLVKNGYLDNDLEKYLENRRQQSRGKKKLADEKRLLETARLVISELGINPDAQVLALILDRKWKDETGQAISDLRGIVEKIKEQKVGFEQMMDKDKLVEFLAENKQAAAIYYVLFGGKTRFALVNSYNSEKFYTILKVLAELKEHPKPLQEFERALLAHGMNKHETNQVLENLRAGRFPLGGTYAKEIRLDVSHSSRLESLERQSRGVFGSKQLGVVLKTEIYRQYLSRQGDAARLTTLEQTNGLADLEKIIEEIENHYPDTLDLLENDKKLTDNWRKLGDKNVFSLSLRAVLNEAENPINLRELLANLEVQRKSLVSQYRQKSAGYLKKLSDPSVRRQEKQKIQEQIERIEEKGSAKLLSYLMAETVGLEKGAEGEADLAPITQKILAEWESHLEQIFGEYQAIDSQAKGAGQRKERKVTLRYLDKRQDLVTALRFADAAQCCFTSTQYRIEGHEVGNAEWVARLHKDPLSFVFVLEDNETEAEKRSAIGFVFGSFGLQDKQPIILLNGVYLEGKTDIAAQSVVNTIEQDFSRPLKMTKQFVAAKHGGTSRYGPNYSNDSQTVRRLRAIASTHSREPENQIYDDLSVGVNELGQTDGHVFYKSLI